MRSNPAGPPLSLPQCRVLVGFHALRGLQLAVEAAQSNGGSANVQQPCRPYPQNAPGQGFRGVCALRGLQLAVEAAQLLLGAVGGDGGLPLGAGLAHAAELRGALALVAHLRAREAPASHLACVGRPAPG